MTISSTLGFYSVVKFTIEYILSMIYTAPIVLFVCIWFIKFIKRRVILSTLLLSYQRWAPQGIKSRLAGICIFLASLVTFRLVSRIYTFVSESLGRFILVIILLAIVAWFTWKFVKWYRSLSKAKKFALSAVFSLYITVIIKTGGWLMQYLV